MALDGALVSFIIGKGEHCFALPIGYLLIRVELDF